MTRISLIFKYPNIYKVKHKEKVQYVWLKINGSYSDIMQTYSDCATQINSA